MERRRIRWSKLLPIGLCVLAGIALIAVLPGVLRRPAAPPLPADVGLAFEPSEPQRPEAERTREDRDGGARGQRDQRHQRQSPPPPPKPQPPKRAASPQPQPPPMPVPAPVAPAPAPETSAVHAEPKPAIRRTSSEFAWDR